jgi:hypothetical protein
MGVERKEATRVANKWSGLNTTSAFPVFLRGGAF